MKLIVRGMVFNILNMLSGVMRQRFSLDILDINPAILSRVSLGIERMNELLKGVQENGKQNKGGVQNALILAVAKSMNRLRSQLY